MLREVFMIIDCHLSNLSFICKILCIPGETMLKFLNENWKQISTEFGTPLLEIAAKILYKNVRTFFKKNPLADIANI